MFLNISSRYAHFQFYFLAILFFTVSQPLTVIEFEKDDDTNGHIDFITSSAVSRIFASLSFYSQISLTSKYALNKKMICKNYFID